MAKGLRGNSSTMVAGVAMVVASAIMLNLLFANITSLHGQFESTAALRATTIVAYLCSIPAALLAVVLLNADRGVVRTVGLVFAAILSYLTGLFIVISLGNQGHRMKHVKPLLYPTTEYVTALSMAVIGGTCLLIEATCLSAGSDGQTPPANSQTTLSTVT